MSLSSLGPTWRTISVAVLYKFSKEARRHICQQLRSSPGCGSTGCTYDESEDMFRITCVAEETNVNLTTLTKLLDDYVTQELEKAEASNYEMSIAPLQPAFVQVDHFERSEMTFDEVEITLAEEHKLPPQSNAETLWRPKFSLTDIGQIASKVNLDEIDSSTSCVLVLDESAGAISIHGHHDSQMKEALERLDEMEKQQNEQNRIDHIGYVNQTSHAWRVRFFLLGRLKDESFGRVIVPTDWPYDVVNEKVLAKMSIMRVVRYDVMNQEYVEIRRDIAEPPMPLEARDIWTGFHFRPIGAAQPTRIFQTPATVPEMSVYGPPKGKVIDRWRAQIEPGKPETETHIIDPCVRSQGDVASQFQFLNLSEPAHLEMASACSETTIATTANEVIEEDIEVRHRMPGGKKTKPGPKENRRSIPKKNYPSAKATLQNLKADYEASKKPIPLETSGGLAQSSRVEEPAPKDIKSRLDPPKVPMDSAVNEKLIRCIESALQRSQELQIPLRMQVQLGQVLLSGDAWRRLAKNYQDTNWGTVKEGLLSLHSFSAAHGNFTNAVSSSASETLALLHLFGMEQQEAYSREAFWELICSASDGSQVRIYLDAQEDAAPTVIVDRKTLGTVYFHAFDRVHDARLLMTEIPGPISNIPEAEELISHIFFRPTSVQQRAASPALGSDLSGTSRFSDVVHGTCPVDTFMARDGALNVKAVHLRSMLRYQIDEETGSHYLELVRVQDFPIVRADATQIEDAGVFGLRRVDDDELVQVQRLWYEVSLGVIDSPCYSATYEASPPEQGAERQSTSWVDESSLARLETLTHEFLDKMDCIGFANRGPAFGLDDRIADSEARTETAHKSVRDF